MTQGTTENRRPQREQIQKNTAPKKRRRRRKPVVQFRMTMLLFIWLICFISCFAAYMIGQNLFPDENAKTESSTQQTTSLHSDDTDSAADSAAAGAVKTNPVPKGSTMTRDYLQQCAFLGDSIVYGLGASDLLDVMNVYSSETLTLESYQDAYVSVNGSQMRFLSSISGASCPIYLMFGTDSLAASTPEAAADRFSVLLNAIIDAAPAADIFVLSVPPVTDAAETAENAVCNADIDSYNSMLLSLANSANVYFVDTNTALKNNESKLDTANAAEDGIHLTDDAARKLLDYVLCHVPA